MPTFTFGDLTFDTTATPAAIVHGYSKAQRDALTDDHLIKVRDLAVKSNLDSKLTKGLQVTTYNPADMKDSNNFFNFVSQWETVILQMETHFKTHHMETPFTLFYRSYTDPDQIDLDVYEMELSAFLVNSVTAGGTPLMYDDGTNVIQRPTRPERELTVTEHGSILRGWHAMTLDQVIDSVRLQIEMIDDNTQRQNLVWSFQYIMNCLDADLRTFVLSKIASLDPAVGRSRPVAFMIVAQRILQTTENLAQKVINGFIALRLTHFEGESVIEAIFTVRNVLKFLRYGEANSYAPRTSIVLLYDVFRGTSVGAFRAYVQQAQDIVLKDATDPEMIFDHLQLKYEELLLADRWVPTKKKPSAFHLGEPRTYTDAEIEKKKKDETDGDKKGNGKKERPTHDKSGRKIDYTPPKQGEQHTRTRDGVTEYWCGKCGRWGSHLSSKHDEWKDNFKKHRGKKKSDDTAAAAGSNTTPSSNTTRGSVTFISALTGNLRLNIDPELADGVDL